MTSRAPIATLRHAAVLCWIAGFVDAIGYFHFGHVFTANMTGNTVLFGAAIVRADPIALTYAGTLVAFIIGVVAAVITKARDGGLHWPFALDALILAGICVATPPSSIVLPLLAFAMGVQGGTISVFSGIRVPTIVVTSTLVNLIEGITLRTAPALSAATPPNNDQLRHLFVGWFAYGVGGGAAVVFDAGFTALLGPAIAFALIALDFARRHKIAPA